MSEIKVRWNEIKENIKREYDLSQVSYDTWIVPLKFYEEKDNVVSILIPSNQSHALNYINDKYKGFFQVTISEMMGKTDSYYDIKFILEKNAGSDEETLNNELVPTYNINYASANLNHKYTFDTFVVGSNNALAHSASVAVAETPGNAFNPLFLYGGPGLGKTHLMHSIGHYILEHNPEMKVLYVTSETFTNELIESLRNVNEANINKWREKYRNVDVLMVDDVQFIIGKERTQEEFFHTFNALHGVGKQVILSSDKPPKDMETLDERFRSRFEMGLIADIQAPDYETRMAILKKNADNLEIEISDDIFQYIANNIKSNIRELEGALNRIVAQYNIDNRREGYELPLTLELVERYLKDLIKPDNNKQITPELIINVVAKAYDVTYDDIVSTRRNAEFVLPRQIVMYISRRLLDTSLEGVAKALGKKDHTTIMHGAKKIDNEIKTNKEFKENIEKLIDKINAQ